MDALGDSLKLSGIGWANLSEPFTGDPTNATGWDGFNQTTESPALEEEDPEAYLYKVAEDFFLGFDPILTCMGLLGNILTFVVMQRRNLRQSSVTVYLSALAVTDCLVLFLDFINNWLKMSQYRVYLLGTSAGFCKSYRFFFNVCYTNSAWLVAAVAVERFIAVWLPLRAKQICTRRHAFVVVAVSPVAISAFYLYNLWAWTLDEDGKCNMEPAWEKFQSTVGPWMSAAAYSYIPATIIIGANVGIIIRLVLARRQRAAMSGRDDGCVLSPADRRIAVMVLVICLTFLLLTLPLTFWYVIVFAAGEFVNEGPRTVLIEVFILTLGLSNHAVNFFLYTLTSERFRSELVSLFTFCLPCLGNLLRPRKPTDRVGARKRAANRKPEVAVASGSGQGGCASSEKISASVGTPTSGRTSETNISKGLSSVQEESSRNVTDDQAGVQTDAADVTINVDTAPNNENSSNVA